MAQRSLPKGAQARRRVLEAVVDAVAAKGLANLSVAEIGGAVGMSGGHVLYYFGTKDTLFVEALKHVESALDQPRAELVADTRPPTKRLRRYVELYLPTGRSDPRWSLWVEVWSRSLTDPDLCAVQLELDARWQRDLATLVRAGIASGDFRCSDVDAGTSAVAALLDGLAIRVMTGGPAADSAATVALGAAGCLRLLGA
jgi:AcrR family transcriptional regulator